MSFVILDSGRGIQERPTESEIRNSSRNHEDLTAYGYASALKFGYGYITLMDKEAMYGKLLNASGCNMPDLVYIKNQLAPVAKSIEYIDNIKPDIYIAEVGDVKLNFTSVKPKLVILYDIDGKKIMLRTANDQGMYTRSVYNLADDIDPLVGGGINHSNRSGKTITYGYVYSMTASTIKKLIVEFIAEHYNPTAGVHTTDPGKSTKDELLLEIEKMRDRISQLEDRIRNM